MRRGESFSGEYQGGFELPSPEGEMQTVKETGLLLKFVHNSVNGWNIQGTGTNKLGPFRLVGCMSPSDPDAAHAHVEFGKEYLTVRPGT
jgi:hypothetical protein